MQVELTYFKATGKYYSEGSFEVDDMDLHLIWDRVVDMREAGELPGLCRGGGKDFIIQVDVPGHRHEHPRLIMPHELIEFIKRRDCEEAALLA